jgi:hypothetical protein
MALEEFNDIFNKHFLYLISAKEFIFRTEKGFNG